MSRIERTVIIVGAGPVGLVLAWQLTRAGLPVRVFESAALLEPMMRSSTFHPPTLDLLDADGVSEALHAAGRITPTWQIRLHETGECAEFDLGLIADATRHPWRLQCDQSVLVRTLESRLSSIDPRLVVRGAQVIDAGQDEYGAFVDVRYGAQPKTQRERGAFVIGCDGSRSVVREALGARFEGSSYPETTLLVATDFPFESHLPGLSGINYVWAPDGTYSLLHLPKLWRVSLHLGEGESPEVASRRDWIMPRLAAIAPLAADANLIETRPYRVHQRLASRWHRGRLAIAGDAAHLNHPKGGMGMNGGIHDAFELAATLIEILAGAPLELLSRYERRRLPVVRDDIIAQADQNRSRMWEPSLDGRRALLAQLQAVANDPQRCRAHLMRSSMIDGLRRSRALN